MKYAATAGLLLFLLAPPLYVRAQATENPNRDPLDEAVAADRKQQKSDATVLLPPNPPLIIADSTTRAHYREAWKALYDYQVSGFAHRKKVFAWQFLSAKITFFSVLILVFTGICFSGIQFYKSLIKHGKKGDAEPTPHPSELELSAKGLKISSPVLGVIILVISLAFFYLYLVYVFPIQEVF